MQQLIKKSSVAAILALAIMAVSFGLIDGVFSQSTGLDAELEPSLTGGYEVGVPVEVNGEQRELDVGDIVFTGTVNEVDKGGILSSILQGLDTNAETATVLGLVSEVLSLPDSYCDFNDLDVGASFSTGIVDLGESESYSENLKFSFDGDCNILFDGKDVVEELPPETEQEDSEFDLSSLFGGSSVHAAKENDDATGNGDTDEFTRNRYCLEEDDFGRSSVEYGDRNRDDTSYSGATTTRAASNTVSKLGVIVGAFARTEDKYLVVRDNLQDLLIRGRTIQEAWNLLTGRRYTPIFAKDCVVFFTVTDVDYEYDDGLLLVRNGSDGFDRADGDDCNTWQPFPNGELGWIVVRCNRTERNGAALAQARTDGSYRINTEHNLFLEALGNAGVNYDRSLDNRTFELDAYSELSREDGRRDELRYGCVINRLPIVQVINPPDEPIPLVLRARFGTFLSEGSFFTDLDIPDGGVIDAHLECRIKIFENGNKNSLTNSPGQLERPPEDNRQPPSLGRYVSLFFDDVSFVTEEQRTRRVPATYSVSRYGAFPLERVSVYTTERRSRRVPAYNYGTDEVPVYNYANRSFTVYNYENRTRPAYNYETRERAVYNYEEREYCVRRGGFLWLSCREWGTRQVRVAPYTETYRVRVAPFTETYRVRVAPFSEVRQVRVPPFSEEVRVRVPPYTRIEYYDARVFSHYNWVTPSPSHGYRHGVFTRAENLIRTGRYPDINRVVLSERDETYTHSESARYNTSGAIAVHTSGRRDTNWSSTLRDLGELREHDDERVVGDVTKVMTTEALRVASAMDIEIGPFARENTMTLDQLRIVVRDTNSVSGITSHSARESELRRRLGRYS